MPLRDDERRILKRALRHFMEGRLAPSEQAELRELLVRYNHRAVRHDLPTLIQLARNTLGLDALHRLVDEKEAAVRAQRAEA